MKECIIEVDSLAYPLIGYEILSPLYKVFNLPMAPLERQGKAS
jgi:hypothetical protein